MLLSLQLSADGFSEPNTFQLVSGAGGGQKVPALTLNVNNFSNIEANASGLGLPLFSLDAKSWGWLHKSWSYDLAVRRTFILTSGVTSLVSAHVGRTPDVGVG